MKNLICAVFASFIMAGFANGQVVERPRPARWDSLVLGGRFIDRFLPMVRGHSGEGVWGAKGVQDRYVDNGIEDSLRSYWGGNIRYDRATDLYNLYVCGWDEKSVKGHHQWPYSIVYRAVSKQMQGPYLIKDTIGSGHNPELFRAKNGTYVLYVIDKRYTAPSPQGPWKQDTFHFDSRGRKIIEGLSNLTFAQRSDGSYLMVCRGGGVWFSRDGLSTYHQVTDKRVYPAVAGEFEDPVVWRDHVQYHLIVNDWLGRIAFYLRSKDGVHWVTDPGEAYTNQIAQHTDGTKEEWFKFERMKVFQDSYGRAIQANFAVIDVLKDEDKGGDNHSSKNIAIPLNPGLLITLLNKDMPTPEMKTIQVKIHAEPGFDPLEEIDLATLRFGASDQVNFGGGSKALRATASGRDLLVTFDGVEHGITEAEFAPKLIGKTKKGKLLYGYMRAPWQSYRSSILSARKPVFLKDKGVFTVQIENFGEIISEEAEVSLYHLHKGRKERVAGGRLQPLAPFTSTALTLTRDAVSSALPLGTYTIVIEANNDAKLDFDFQFDGM
ncbi:glycoside hydrolase family protein [Olivibacter sp. XZL3]|uniref:glycoside hydrolase family protein n=1 Tax=Olivibacter sp. XZL3 TaxID=1735116 RepID=UPI001064DF3F|nr:glycoside hydrolase family protein [Olivibacter sp. XZL3]